MFLQSRQKTDKIGENTRKTKKRPRANQSQQRNRLQKTYNRGLYKTASTQPQKRPTKKKINN